MNFSKLQVSGRSAIVQQHVERMVNRMVRGLDKTLGLAHLGGRKAEYDDAAYSFLGGMKDRLRAKHYDKSLRLLWKAEEHTPWAPFRDATRAERSLFQQATGDMGPAVREARERLALPEFRAMLDREYSLREKQALVRILSAIGHGEAYAWLVAAELLAEVRSTGAKAALTMQVLEEAKHFVVLRELVHAFNLPVPRLTAYEYVLLEQSLKASGLEKFLGMNVVVEGIALSTFGMLGSLPGLEVLKLFHLDESRHAGLPVNYLSEFPLSRWQKHSPLRRLSRLKLILPAVPLIFYLEQDMAELGIDTFDLAGSVVRKISTLAERTGFFLPIPYWVFQDSLNLAFNAYCLATRPGYVPRDFRTAETTRGKRQRKVERDAFGLDAA